MDRGEDKVISRTGIPISYRSKIDFRKLILSLVISKMSIACKFPYSNYL